MVEWFYLFCLLAKPVLFSGNENMVGLRKVSLKATTTYHPFKSTLPLNHDDRLPEPPFVNFNAVAAFLSTVLLSILLYICICICSVFQTF